MLEKKAKFIGCAFRFETEFSRELVYSDLGGFLYEDVAQI